MPRSGISDHMVTLYLVFWGTSTLFFIVTVTLYIALNSVREFLFSPHHFWPLLFVDFLMMALLTDRRW